MARTRRPPGSPAGGEFAPRRKSEPDPTLIEDVSDLLAEAGEPVFVRPPKTEEEKERRLPATLGEMTVMLNVASGFVADGRAIFDSSLERRMACERLFEILGEQVKRLSDAYKADHPDIAWSSVVGMRDRVAHGYGSELHGEIVWHAMAEDLMDMRRVLGL